MPKWIIDWDAGYGANYDIVDNATEDEAQQAAYEQWLQEAESNAIYGAKPYTKEEAVLCDLEEDANE